MLYIAPLACSGLITGNLFASALAGDPVGLPELDDKLGKWVAHILPVSGPRILPSW
jgi:hypothetical protein